MTVAVIMIVVVAVIVVTYWLAGLLIDHDQPHPLA
jgi:hypothetical protein